MWYEFFYNFCLKHLSFQEELSEIRVWSEMCIRSSCKLHFIRVRFCLNFVDRFFEKYSDIKFSWKSVQWEPSCSMRTDGRTNMTKLTVAFRNIANPPTHNIPLRFSTYLIEIQTRSFCVWPLAVRSLGRSTDRPTCFDFCKSIELLSLCVPLV